MSLLRARDCQTHVRLQGVATRACIRIIFGFVIRAAWLIFLPAVFLRFQALMRQSIEPRFAVPFFIRPDGVVLAGF